jgi:hypothetical protein
VTTTLYPIGVADFDSSYLNVNDVNTTSGYTALQLNDTRYSGFSDIGAFQDQYGAVLSDDADYNVITASSFVDDTSYGVYIVSGYENEVYTNDFIGDNGATSVYNALHIQAWSSPDNGFSFEETGNYWADWHTYNAYGDLAPYYVSSQVWDYYPLGTPEGTYAVYFEQDTLPPGVSWSVTFDGVTQSTIGSWILVGVLPGSYAFSVGAVAGYMVTPSSGSLSVSQVTYQELTYSALYSVSFKESGAPSGASWWVTLGGTTQTGTGSSIVFSEPAGTYAYQVGAPAGWTVSPSSGSLTVTNANYTVNVAFAQVLYAVTLSEGGLATGTTWSATVNGSTQSTSGTSLTWYLPNGTYPYSFGAVSGYNVGSSGSGSVLVKGQPVSQGATYTSTSSPSSVASTSSLNTYFTVALAIAVIALVVALIALLMRRKKAEPETAPPTAWTPPPSGAGGSGGSASWSEGTGPSAGGPPPPPS